MTKRPLVVWRDSPLDLERPLWSWTADRWGGDARVVHARALPPERTTLDWGASSIREVHVGEDAARAVGRVRGDVDAFDDALHVFYGLRGTSGRVLDIVCRQTQAPVVVVAERPTRHEGGVPGLAKTLASKAVYASLSRRYRDRIGAFLAMGLKGCQEYEDAGFRKDSIFPFMYAPFDPAVEAVSAHRGPGVPVRFIYVGRLDSRYKGLDVLLEAVSALDPSTPWTLDIVGGYGELTTQVSEFAESHPLVNFLGAWQPGQVVQQMTAYDVTVVPSRYDGWNAVTNHAVNAGLGVIVSDQATSDELVRASGAGKIVGAGSVRQLTEAMVEVIGSPWLVEDLKAKARRYSPAISTERVGAYLLEVLEYASERRDPAAVPTCPWL